MTQHIKPVTAGNTSGAHLPHFRKTVMAGRAALAAVPATTHDHQLCAVMDGRDALHFVPHRPAMTEFGKESMCECLS